MLALAALLSLCLSGCAKEAVPPENPLWNRPTSFESELRVTRGDWTASAELIRRDPEADLIQLTAPETIAALRFRLGKDAVELDYKGMAVQVDPRALPPGAFPRCTLEVLQTALHSEELHPDPQTPLELSGLSPAGAFTLTLEPDALTPRKLSLPAEELEIEFVNFRFLE